MRVMGEAGTVDEFVGSSSQRAAGSPFIKPSASAMWPRWKTVWRIFVAFPGPNGVSAVGLGVRKQRGSNAVAVADEVLRRMEEVRKDLPQGLTIDLNFDTTRFIRESVHELVMTLVLAAVLTSLVCWLFLGSLGFGPQRDPGDSHLYRRRFYVPLFFRIYLEHVHPPRYLPLRRDRGG